MSLTDFTVKKSGQKLELTAKEFEILKLFLKNPQKVYTKEQIYSLVWNDAYCGDFLKLYLNFDSEHELLTENDTDEYRDAASRRKRRAARNALQGGTKSRAGHGADQPILYAGKAGSRGHEHRAVQTGYL